MRYTLYILYTLFLLTSCQATPKQETKEQAPQATEAQVRFPYPEIPTVLTTPEERKAYLLTHYWERFDFADTVLVANRDITEQGFVDFIALLADGQTTDALAGESMENWCGGFIPQGKARRTMMRLADDYLYNPNSPFYNEWLYGIYLQAMLVKLPAEDAQVSSMAFKLQLLNRNKVGTPAEDFIYYLPDGTRRSLADTPVRGNRLLVVFYDPECSSCHEVIETMKMDSALAKAVQAGWVSVLAIYTEGNEKVWRETLADMPQGWSIGTDREAIKAGALYDLRAMPSLYLLDAQKRVVLKDAPFERIRSELFADGE